jgi:hypothetical protein
MVGGVAACWEIVNLDEASFVPWYRNRIHWIIIVIYVQNVN